ncbi:MAG: cytochrome P450 [Acidimicrobiales bacterium]
MTSAGAKADFDHNSLSWLADRHAHNAELRQQCPVVWNQRYGGFWFVTGYDEVAAVARDSETFTTRFEENATDGLTYVGIAGVPRPEGLPAIGIGEAVGDRHAALRRAINPFMLPPAVARDRAFVERAANWFLDQRIAEGRMDMVLDFTNPVPGLWTMELLGLPATQWEHYAAYFHAVSAYGPDMPEYQEALSRTPEMIAELLDIIEERRRDPGEDLLSRLVELEMEGKPLGQDDMIGVLWNLIGGGLDTTTSLTSLALVHLAEHPQLRQRIVDDLDLLMPACEEYLRWTSINETLTRTCTKDTELAGQQIKRGDFVMMSWLGANFDQAVFERPDVVDVDRSPNPHLAFGVGTHRCIGLHVARMLFLVMMREILTRIPDYVVERESTQFYQGNPALYGVVKMPVTFTPGTPLGVERPF